MIGGDFLHTHEMFMMLTYITKNLGSSTIFVQLIFPLKSTKKTDGL